MTHDKMKWLTRSRGILVVSMLLPALAITPKLMAGTVTVDTGATGSQWEWTVDDPDFGSYTVTVSGAAGHAQKDGTYYYRNASESGENDDVYTWTISGLNSNAVITRFVLESTRIAPSVGSGSNWNYNLTLTGPGMAGTVSDYRQLTGGLVYATPVMSVLDISFGNAPSFDLIVDEYSPFSTRTVGTETFTITADWSPDVVPANPVPADGLTDVKIAGGVTLQWDGAVTPPAGLSKYLLYITDNGTAGDPNFSGVTPIEVALGADPITYGPKPIVKDKTYYWRVDQVADPNSIAGRVWSFETEKSVPVIMSQPENAVVPMSESVAFIVEFESFYAPTVTWYRNNGFEDALIAGGGHYTVTTTNTNGIAYQTVLTIDAAEVGDTAYYFCVIENAAGTDTSGRGRLIVPAMVAYYPFEGTLEDSAGEHDGSMVGGDPNFAAGLPNFGQALDLENTAEKYVDLGADAQPSGLTLETGSASFWFLIDDPSETRIGLMAVLNDGGYQRLQIALDNNRGFITNKDATGAQIYIVDDNALAANEWHNLIATWTLQEGFTYNLYVDGKLIRQVSINSWEVEPWHYGIAIGATNNAGAVSNYWDGLIDEVKVYNYALSLEEIAEEWYAGSGQVTCLAPPAYDLSGDCMVDLNDFTLLTTEWLVNGNWPQ